MTNSSTEFASGSSLRKSILIGAGVLAGSAAISAVLAIKAERDNPPHGKFIEVDGVRLHYTEQGSGPSVVFLHGNGGMIQDFESSGVLELAAAHNHVIAFDRPGFGHSERPGGRDWGPSAQADLFAKAFAQMSISPATIVGHSWGTLVALALAIEHPESVARIVLLSGYYYPTLRLDTALSVPGAAPLLGQAIQHTVGPLIGLIGANSAIAQMFEPRLVPQAFRDTYSVGLAVRPSQLKAAAAETVMMPWVASKLARQYGVIRLPVSILAGADDAIVDTPSQSGRLHEEIASSTFKSFAGVGHMVHHAVPKDVVNALT